MKVNTSGMERRISRLERSARTLERELPARMAARATDMGVRALARSVYDTPEGHYNRTGKLLDAFRALITKRGTRIISAARYASYIEQLPPGGLQLLITRRSVTAAHLNFRGSSSKPPYLGRSGLEWRRPGPHVSPAAAAAADQARAEILDLIKRG